ncbi:hypothetical protein RB195_012569 [Necator americanus]|uniref:Uncharacterized protein n=1 Tax=Necator americanus TaxID=51031 RepID=A0ABR1DU84_NECAM
MQSKNACALSNSGIPVSKLVPRGNVTIRGPCYGTPQRGILGCFERFIKCAAQKADVERTQFYCESIDTDAQNICGICY